MKRCALRLFLSVLCVALASPLAFAQGSATSSISGVVTDAGGGAVPGAVVVAKNTATAVTTQAVTNTSGNYTVPSIDLGRYTVTISLSGFKTVNVENVVVLASSVATVNATLEVGTLNETVNVKANSEMIQTSSSTVQTTMTVDQIAGLPLVSRNALNFMVFLPGVETPGTARASTVNGLPQSVLSISIDGVNVQDNFNKTGDGFFARVTPRLDSIEQVTVSSAGAGADSAGQGAVTIKFVTRSGTNQYTGSAYHYFRHPSLNTNYYFNKVNGLDKNEVIVNQPGARFGGPIVIPSLYDGRGKAFFFMNYEEFRQPTQVTRTRTVLTTGAQAGVYSWTTAGATQTRDVMALAAASGFTPTMDPTVVELLNKIADGNRDHGRPQPEQSDYGVVRLSGGLEGDQPVPDDQGSTTT